MNDSQMSPGRQAIPSPSKRSTVDIGLAGISRHSETLYLKNIQQAQAIAGIGNIPLGVPHNSKHHGR